MRKKIGIVMIVIGVAVILLLIHSFISEYRASDACLDAGGSFNYEALECDRQSTHTFVPFVERHASTWLFVVASSVLVALTGQ
jgi:hypothetical protein